MTADDRKELEASAALGETALWIHSLAEEAERGERSRAWGGSSAPRSPRNWSPSSWSTARRPARCSMPLSCARIAPKGLRGVSEGCSMAAWERGVQAANRRRTISA
jgi:hypothetical protein